MAAGDKGLHVRVIYVFAMLFTLIKTKEQATS